MSCLSRQQFGGLGMVLRLRRLLMKLRRRDGMPSSSIGRDAGVIGRSGSSEMDMRWSSIFSPQRPIKGDEPVATFFPLNPESKGGKKVPLKPTGENKTGMSLPLGASTIFCELRSFVRSPETIRSKFDSLMATVVTVPSHTLSMSVPRISSTPM